ncbi:MAG TPA: acylphosphatase [Oculatellaceae cyanobacterium]
MNTARVRLVVLGKVQGVFYRHSTREKARELGLSGWVRNLSDGSVEVEASGAKTTVEQLISWCRRGPANARVEDVVVEWQESTVAPADTAGGVMAGFEIH